MNAIVKPVIIGVRVAIGFVFIQMAGQKLVFEDFYSKGLPVRMADFISAMQENELSWKFIAISQITIAVLLITQRFATLGAIMLLPMTASLYIISIDTPGSIKITNGILLGLNILLLAYDYQKLRSVFISPFAILKPEKEQSRINDVLITLGILLIVSGFTCALNGMPIAHKFLTISAWAMLALVPVIYAVKKTKERFRPGSINNPVSQ